MSKKEKLMDQGRDLIEMYKAGFLDGYNCDRSRELDLKKLGDKCLKAFEKRFVKRIRGKVKA